MTASLVGAHGPDGAVELSQAPTLPTVERRPGDARIAIRWLLPSRAGHKSAAGDSKCLTDADGNASRHSGCETPP